MINRGNYRSGIFKTEGSKKSFLKTLQECCGAMNWKLHAWVLMGNHYHLCIETPEANLVSGMSWLQSVFANRFNRVRKANGHVFQGRYKAILLDGHALGQVCHYIHLNPVRANMVECQKLESFRYSSFHQLWNPRKRWKFGVYWEFLDAAGHLDDTPEGHHLYKDYLNWLSEEDDEQMKMGFERMCRGWYKGSKEFKEKVLQEQTDATANKVVEAEASEIRELQWDRLLPEVLLALGKESADILNDRKGAPWKVAVARYFREKYLAPHRWISARLQMGAVSYVQSLVSRHRASSEKDEYWDQLMNELGGERVEQ